MINILIGDSSSCIRKTLLQLIDELPYTNVVGEADNGLTLIELSHNVNPNVVILDIEMPKMNGIEVAKILYKIDPSLIIIFTSTNEKFIYEAFELYAYDFIKKTDITLRIRQTLNRIYSLEQNRLFINYMQNRPKIKSSLKKLIVKSEGGIKVINTKDIVFITRFNRKLQIRCTKDTISVWGSIDNILKKLPPNFFRAHKGYIVNTDYINQLLPYGKKTFEIYFTNCSDTALMTRDMANIFIENFCK